MSIARQNFPFFIVGAQRSGTTLLRLLLNAHSMIAVPEEARFLTPLLRRRFERDGLDRSMLRKLADYLALSREFANWNYDSTPTIEQIASLDHSTLGGLLELLYSGFAESEGKQFWGDKSLFFRHIGVLATTFPSSSFIHVVRDGRDVFDSWRKMDPSKNHAPTAALDWRLKLGMIESAFGRLPPGRTLTIRYEDLIADPGRVMAAICGFLDVAFEEDMLSFHRHSGRYIGKHHSRLIFSSIDSANHSKWPTALDTDELRAYDVIAGRQLERFGYGRSRHTYGIVERARTRLGVAEGLAARAKGVFCDARERRRALKAGRATRAISVGESPAQTRPPGA